MTATAFDLETVVLEGLAHEFVVPCDYGDEWPGVPAHEAPAEWVLHLTRCTCGAAGARLACDDCKRKRLEDSSGAVMCVECGAITAPAREAYSYCEPLGG